MPSYLPQDAILKIRPKKVKNGKKVFYKNCSLNESLRASKLFADFEAIKGRGPDSSIGTGSASASQNIGGKNQV